MALTKISKCSQTLIIPLCGDGPKETDVNRSVNTIATDERWILDSSGYQSYHAVLPLDWTSEVVCDLVLFYIVWPAAAQKWKPFVCGKGYSLYT